jgi:large subunit ribosomal protein L21
MMYAIIKTGGKQYKVKEGDKLKVEKLELAPGADLKITEVLYVSNGETGVTGAPYVIGASVSARVLEQGRDKKILIVKMRRRKHYRRRQGHRQYQTQIEITKIQAG